MTDTPTLFDAPITVGTSRASDPASSQIAAKRTRPWLCGKWFGVGDRAAYMREYRKRKPSAREYDRAQLRAYKQALRILRERHRDEFDAIYNGLRSES